jgi:hypothetical protein
MIWKLMVKNATPAVEPVKVWKEAEPEPAKEISGIKLRKQP